MLWPYRRSAPKNQRRWTFGGVHPTGMERGGPSRRPLAPRDRVPDDALGPGDGGGCGPTRGARRSPLPSRGGAQGGPGRRRAPWLSRTPWRWAARRGRRGTRPGRGRWCCRPSPPARGRRCGRSALYAASEREWLKGAGGPQRRGAVVRTWRTLEGEVTARCEDGGRWCTAGARRGVKHLGAGRGTTGRTRSAPPSPRPTWCSAAAGAAFASLTDPPPGLEAAAEACSNDGWWPVLVGPRGATTGHGVPHHPPGLSRHRAREPGRPLRRRRDRRDARAAHHRADRRGAGGDAGHGPADAGDPGADAHGAAPRTS